MYVLTERLSFNWQRFTLHKNEKRNLELYKKNTEFYKLIELPSYFVYFAIESLQNYKFKKQNKCYYKQNGYTFKGNHSYMKIFTCLLTGGLLLKERICSRGSKFFPLRAGPSFERTKF